MGKFRNMSKNMQELLSVTQNMQNFKSLKMGIEDKLSAGKLKRQYDEYNHQINMINDVFQSSMGPGNKNRQSEDALKRSNYLLKKSMQAAMCLKQGTKSSSSNNKSLKSENMKHRLEGITQSSISVHNPNSYRGDIKGVNLERELAKINNPTPSKDLDFSSNQKKKGYDSGRTPPSLLSSIFEQAVISNNSSNRRPQKININELAFSKSDKHNHNQYKPEKDIKEMRSNFEESSLEYSVNTLSRFQDNKDL
jgi:hypothetical protein